MSYDIYLYDISAKNNTNFDPENPPDIPASVLNTFKQRLLNHDYRVAHEESDHAEYEHTNAKWGIQVNVFPTEIAFSVPYWDDAEDAMFEALMTANELCDDQRLAVYDPQDGSWSNS